MKSFMNYIIESYDFSSAQIEMPVCISQKIKEFSDKIPDDHVAEDGVEKHHHVTIKYGIHSSDYKVLDGIELPESITVTLGKTSIFENDTGDVLKINVISDDLHKLNALIASKVKVTDTYPDYIPHCTIAYLKAGKGKLYNDDDTFEGLTWTFTKIQFSSSDDIITNITLN